MALMEPGAGGGDGEGLKGGANSAVAVVAPARVRVQSGASSPAQGPGPHLAKWLSGAAVAVRVTVEPSPNSPVQVVPHSIPGGELVTSPEPAIATLRALVGTRGPKAKMPLTGSPLLVT